MIPQFTADQVEASFRQVGSKVSAPVIAFLFGGGAMARMGAKAATRDVDISLRSERERTELGSALKALGAVHQEIGAQPNPGSRRLWVTPDRMGWDLFTSDVMGFRLRQQDYASSEPWLEVGAFSLRCLSGSLIFIMKAFTPRTRDLEDMFRLLNHGAATDDEVVALIRSRIAGDNYQPWLAHLFAAVNELGDQYDINVGWINEFEIAATDALVAARILDCLSGGPLLEEDIARRLDIGVAEVGDALLSLQRHEWVSVEREGWTLTGRRRG